HTRSTRDWSSDVCSSDLLDHVADAAPLLRLLPPLEELEKPERTGACEVPIVPDNAGSRHEDHCRSRQLRVELIVDARKDRHDERSEERRVGKEWRSAGSA